MPAGILLWARPKDDKKLVEVAMALEVALAAAT
jgi:Asp-tRNA(Asn)/Glu-tRNA(Gln) amidotransferase A subunit family amidase